VSQPDVGLMPGGLLPLPMVLFTITTTTANKLTKLSSLVTRICLCLNKTARIEHA